MPHSVCQAASILAVAAALGMKVVARKTHCFNGAAHRSGADDKPALVFQTDVNRFKCYACGAHGDAIDLVRGVRGCTFREAIDWLTDFTGHAAPTQPRVLGGRSGLPTECDKEIYMTLFGLSYRLTPGWPGADYLVSRGIDPKLAAQLDVTEIDDPRGVWEALTNKYTEDQLKAAGLVSQSGRFLFSQHRLLFTYFDDGCPQFIQARDITGKATCKELSLAGGLHSPVPYNSDVLKQAPDQVLICEGAIDTLSATQLGYAAVGVPGVVAFRDEWFPLFRSVGRVTVLFDNDVAGRKQSAELRAKLRMHDINADAQFPSQGIDLNDLLKSLSNGGPI